MARSLGTDQNQSPSQPGCPLVSILIPVYNRVDLTRQCFASLFQHVDPGIATEYLVVDDCSTDETPAYLASLGERVRVLRNEERQCFGYNMNQAAAQARGRYLCLLNNDTLATVGWLKTLIETIGRDPQIGVLGNRHLFPKSGKLNHAGMVFDETGKPTHLYPGRDAEYPPALLSREFQIVTAACWLVPRALFLEMGGFDEGFRNGFEDVDFCLRVRQQNLKVYYCANSVIYHYGQSSPGRTDNDAVNEAYFRNKWAGRIRPDLQDYLRKDVSPAKKFVTKSGRKKAAAPVADVHFAIPLHLANSFSWVTSQLAIGLEDIGVGVSLRPGKIDPSVGPESARRLRAMTQRPASPRVHIKWNHYWDQYLNEELAGDVNAEIFCTNYRYGPGKLQEIDFWMRHVVLNHHRKLPLSGFCRDALTELGVPAERCAVVPCGYSPEVVSAQGANHRYRRHGRVLLAVTNSHDPYRYGTDVLLRAYAKAFRSSDSVVLVLKDYGIGAERSQIAEWLADYCGGPRIIHLSEFSSKEQLIQLYRGADAFVAPFRGEGFGMKILDACAVGLPVICPYYGGPAEYLQQGAFYPVAYVETPVGQCSDRANTILPKSAYWIEPNVDDLATQMRAVVENRAEACRRGALAGEYVLKNFSWKRAAERLRDSLVHFEEGRRQTITQRHTEMVPAKKLSVVISTYNRPEALEKLLSAYRAQTVPRDQWEMILIDDGSNYPVQDLVEPFRKQLPLQLIANKVNSGQAKARMHGIGRSQGELILFTGDDIIPEPNFLAGHLRAHQQHRDEKSAVLGYIFWHPDIAVTTLMEYMTGEGGQQFCFDLLTPHRPAPFACFYTSNVSIKRSFLMEQEEVFSPEFTCYGYEDVELGLRLAQRGMRLWYHPEARAGHLHHITDRQALEREYKVGRMLVTYSLLHPQRVREEHKSFLRWLEMAQHVLLQQPDFVRTCADLAAHSQSLQMWLDQFSAASHALSTHVEPDQIMHLASRASLEKESCRWAKLNKKLYAYQFDLMLRSGMADEWMGVGAEEPNPVRDLVRFYLSAGVWKLLNHGTPDSPIPHAAMSRGERILNLARRIRHRTWLAPTLTGLTRLPGYRPLKAVATRMLQMMS